MARQSSAQQHFEISSLPKTLATVRDLLQNHMEALSLIPGQYSEIIPAPNGLEWRCVYCLCVSNEDEAGVQEQAVFTVSVTDTAIASSPAASLQIRGLNNQKLKATSLSDMNVLHEQIFAQLSPPHANLGYLQDLDTYMSALKQFKSRVEGDLTWL